MREYRFAILRDGPVEDKVSIAISGMMRDALKPTTHGLVRSAPDHTEARPDESDEFSPQSCESKKLLYKRSKKTQRVARRVERRWVTRGVDGQILSSDSECGEEVQERTITQEFDPQAQECDPAESEDQSFEEGMEDLTGQTPPHEIPSSAARTSDEDAVQEIALGEDVPADRNRADGEDSITNAGTGQIYGTFEEMFRDPSFPMGPASDPWAEALLSGEEVIRLYKFVASLAHKVELVDSVNRHEASSACWHAIQCIRDIYARLGDIIETVSIERGRDLS